MCFHAVGIRDYLTELYKEEIKAGDSETSFLAHLKEYDKELAICFERLIGLDHTSAIICLWREVCRENPAIIVQLRVDKLNKLVRLFEDYDDTEML